MNIGSPHSVVFNFTDLFSLEKANNQRGFCKYSRKFADWAEKVADLKAEPTVADVKWAKLILLEKYIEWRRKVPKNHRNKASDRGHTCIFQVFIATYEHLEEVELTITPPLFSEQDEPSIKGLFLGEIDTE